MPHPCQHPPYAWNKPTYELGLTEPGHDEPRKSYVFDLELQHYPMFLEGLWSRMYGQTSLYAREN
jgi:hypothetical protein